MLKITVDLAVATPPWRQIVEAVLDAVCAGELAVGDKLPSVRDLALDALVNPNTVAKAYRDLGFLNVVASRVGAGCYVSEKARAVAQAHREQSTLAAFKRAAVVASRAGHDAARLNDVLDSVTQALPAVGGVQRGTR